MRLYAVDVPFPETDEHSQLNARIFKLEFNEDNTVTFVNVEDKQPILTSVPITEKVDEAMGYGKIKITTEDGTVYRIGHVKEVLPPPVAMMLLMQYGM